MYVAITRARRCLYLTHAQVRMLHGQPRYGMASRFLDEIPEALVKSMRQQRPNPYAARSPGPVSAGEPAPAPRPASANLPYKVGARVSHPKYGEGVVGGYQGLGAETEIKVSFPRHGDKWFILEYARLSAG